MKVDAPSVASAATANAPKASLIHTIGKYSLKKQKNPRYDQRGFSILIKSEI